MKSFDEDYFFELINIDKYFTENADAAEYIKYFVDNECDQETIDNMIKKEYYLRHVFKPIYQEIIATFTRDKKDFDKITKGQDKKYIIIRNILTVADTEQEIRDFHKEMHEKLGNLNKEK